jgi:hypothetical protein
MLRIVKGSTREQTFLETPRSLKDGMLFQSSFSLFHLSLPDLLVFVPVHAKTVALPERFM